MDITALQGTLRKVAAELLRLAEHASIPLHAGAGEKTHVLVDWENVQPDEADCRALVPEVTDVWLAVAAVRYWPRLSAPNFG